MKSSYFRIFLSKISERKWLDSRGAEGLLLESVNDSRYKFTKSEEHTYSYSIEHIGVAPESDAAKEYYESLQDKGMKPVLSGGQWVYFVKEDGEITHTAEKYRKNAKPYLSRSLYYLGFALVFAVVCGYQFYAINMLKSIGHTPSADIIGKIALVKGTGFFDKLLNVLIEIVNFLIGIANRYFKLWQGLLGRSDASAVLAVLLPVTFVLTVLFGKNIYEYFANRKEAKAAAESASAAECATGTAETAAAEEQIPDEAEKTAEPAEQGNGIITEEEDAEQDLQDKTE